MTRFGGLFRNDADVDAAEAAAWLAQHRLGTLDEVAFKTWRDEDVAHAIAFARALAMWDRVGSEAPRSVRELSGRRTAALVPAAPKGPCSRRMFLQAACAVAAVGVVAAGTTATRAYAWIVKRPQSARARRSACRQAVSSRSIRIPGYPGACRAPKERSGSNAVKSR
ncbi:hypothetical protein [Sphingomonas sp. Leaf242]|uniref:hypothetical protein n=1 Tax=Sphingomonas sp. Leaf242 TaxID=1736304 RepID=UPI00071468CC|nr:hypothetical protein [Sphingomonas sp. Leaf242]KQO07831.1 hypothetical protein ASF09_07660 [Sphingomonas sp. Leaf242]